uniref:Uncharacterized protein n=1 Tax=Arion vulgaris TaxID=1028688 RepID=A0A0B7ASA7_9EUPU
MTSNHSPLQVLCLIISLAAVILTTLVAFSNLGRQYGFQEAIPGLLRSNLEAVSNKQPSPISPPAWINCAWGIILIWQVLWCVHGIVSIFRTSYGVPVYTNPVLLSPIMLLLFMFACGLNVSWFILYDRMYTSTSCLFIFLTTATTWATYASALSSMNYNIYRLKKSRMYLEICLSRVLVQNGLAAYAMWGVFVLAFNVSVAVIYNKETHVTNAVSTVIGASIIGCVQIFYFLLDVSCLDSFARYIMTPYIVPIVVLASCMFRQELWVSTDITFILLASLLSFAFLSFMMKGACMAFKIIRNNSGGGDITTSGPTSPVDESYHLLK